MGEVPDLTLRGTWLPKVLKRLKGTAARGLATPATLSSFLYMTRRDSEELYAALEGLGWVSLRCVACFFACLQQL